MKLQEVKTLALESKEIKGFQFVWITNGIGWKDAKKNLEETFDVFDDLYNIEDLNNGVINKLLENKSYIEKIY